MSKTKMNMPSKDYFELIQDYWDCEDEHEYEIYNSPEYTFASIVSEFYDNEWSAATLMVHISYVMDALIRSEILAHWYPKCSVRYLYCSRLASNILRNKFAQTYKGDVDYFMQLRSKGFFTDSINGNSVELKKQVHEAYVSFLEMWELYLDNCSVKSHTKLAIMLGCEPPSFVVKELEDNTDCSYTMIDVYAGDFSYTAYLRSIELPSEVNIVDDYYDVCSFGGLPIYANSDMLKVDTYESRYLKTQAELNKLILSVEPDYNRLVDLVVDAFNYTLCAVLDTTGNNCSDDIEQNFSTFLSSAKMPVPASSFSDLMKSYKLHKEKGFDVFVANHMIYNFHMINDLLFSLLSAEENVKVSHNYFKHVIGTNCVPEDFTAPYSELLKIMLPCEDTCKWLSGADE